MRRSQRAGEVDPSPGLRAHKSDDIRTLKSLGLRAAPNTFMNAKELRCRSRRRMILADATAQILPSTGVCAITSAAIMICSLTRSVNASNHAPNFEAVLL